MRMLLSVLFICGACIFSTTAGADDEEKAEQKAANAFAQTVRGVVAGGDKEALAALVHYPLFVDGAESARDSAAFLDRFDAVITGDVKTCARDHNTAEDVFQRNGQYMIGWGCFWFSPDEKGHMGIDAVNTRMP